MSTQEIIAELPKLNRGELEQVNLKLHELLALGVAPHATGQRLKQFAGAVWGLPSDWRNHMGTRKTHEAFASLSFCLTKIGTSLSLRAHGTSGSKKNLIRLL